MGEITLVTGGARSGKSKFAEELFRAEEDLCYIATNGISRDAETLQRIKLHQERRPANWRTHEGYLAIAEFLQEDPAPAYLLDCATMLTTNYFYHLMTRDYGEDYALIDAQIAAFSQEEKAQLEQRILAEWQQIIAAAKTREAKTVIVTNEVGLGIVPEDAFTRWFRDVYGRVNQFIGGAADTAYLVVAGIPLKIK